jgi:hypothetical protein
MLAKLHFGLSGHIQVRIRQNGIIVKEYPIQSNLILDQGLDKIAQMRFADVFTNCAAGTGTTPTQDLGAAPASQAGTTVTASGASFGAGDVGKLIVWSGGAQAKITVYTDPQTVTVDRTQVVPQSSFSMYRVNQIGLTTEIKRSNQYITTPSSCGTLEQPNRLGLLRTYIFPQETATVTYTEIGVSDASSPGANLFSRILLATPVTVQGPAGQVPGQQLELAYVLWINFTPTTQVSVNVFTGGLPRGTAITLLQNLGSQFVFYTVDDKAALELGQAGGSVQISGASVQAYNGIWTVSGYGNNPATTLPGKIYVIIPRAVGSAVPNVANTGTATKVLGGVMLRLCYGIYIVNALGVVSVPAPVFGATDPGGFTGGGEPSTNSMIFIGGYDARLFPYAGMKRNAPISYPTLNPNQIGSSSLSAYLPGTFTRNKIGVVGQSSVDLLNLGSAWVGFSGNTWDLAMSFQTPYHYTKRSNEIMSVTFTYSWGRASF